MRLTELTIENFLSYGAEQTISLGGLGLVGVFGDHVDSNVADSNGAGKSALLDALTWVLWGEVLKDLKSDQVVNNKVGKNCKVQLTLEDDAVTYQIVRTRLYEGEKKPNNLQVLINNQPSTLGSNSETQKLVNSIIGLSFETFIQCILLTDGSASFCDLKDDEKKEVLENILQIDLLRRAKKAAATRIKQAEEGMRAIDTELLHLTAREDYLIRQYQDLLESDRTYVAKLDKIKKELSEGVADSEQLLAVARKAVPVFEKYKSTYEKNAVRVSALRDDKSTRMHKLMEQQNLAKEQRFQVQTKLNELLIYKRQYQQDASAVSQLAGSVCSSCRQLVDPDTAEEQLTHWGNQIADIIDKEAKLNYLLEQVDELEKTHTEDNKKALYNIDQEERKLEADQQTIVFEIRKLTSRVTEIPYIEKRLEELNKRIEEETSQPNPYAPMIANCAAEKDKLTEQRAIKESERGKISDHLAYLEFWDKGFGNQGIKSYMLDNVVPFLNERAQNYLSILSEGTLTVKFNTQTELKSGDSRERFNVEVSNSQGSDVYQGNSSGEKRRSDIAIGWALADLAASRANKSIRFRALDEPFESLDETGLDAVFRLLNAATSEYETILCITHRSGLKDRFQRELVVEKRDGFSYLRNGGK